MFTSRCTETYNSCWMEERQKRRNGVETEDSRGVRTPRINSTSIGVRDNALNDEST